MDHIDSVYIDTLYSDSMNRKEYKIIFFLTFFSSFLSLSGPLHILEAKNLGFLGRHPKKERKEVLEIGAPFCAHPCFEHPLLAIQEEF